jgi:hypothetical protein
MQTRHLFSAFQTGVAVASFWCCALLVVLGSIGLIVRADSKDM